MGEPELTHDVVVDKCLATRPSGDPSPIKWSDSKYGVATEEDCNGEELQAGSRYEHDGRSQDHHIAAGWLLIGRRPDRRCPIYRPDDSKWTLEVVDSAGTSTVWDDQFDTDEAAHAEFRRCIAEEGILSLTPVRN